MNTTRRPSGLAIVGYGLTAVGFVQVAVTIAPHIAASIPAAGQAAPAVGVAVALAIDACWASLMHTTIQTYRNAQIRPTLGFGGATALAVLASTILLASVGHMGPWSAVPVLAAILLILDGVREHVSVSPETAVVIRERTAEIRDARALAVIEARKSAHDETLNGYRESARLSARTAALAEIKTTVQRANFKANQRITVSQKRFALPKSDSPESLPRITDPLAIHLPDSPESIESIESDTESPQVNQPADQPNHANQTRLSVVPAATPDDFVTQVLALAEKGMSQRQIAEVLTTNQSRVGRIIRAHSA